MQRKETINKHGGSGFRPASVTDIAPALYPIRDRFRSQIVERVIALEGLRINVENGKDPHAAMADIIAIVHKISGVAATLGFLNAGHLAAHLEQHYNEGINARATFVVLWPQVEPMLIALMDELEVIADGDLA